MVGFLQEGRKYNMKLQNMGDGGIFPVGHIERNPTFDKPQWLHSGEALVKVAVQLQIVEELMGGSPGLNNVM